MRAGENNCLCPRKKQEPKPEKNTARFRDKNILRQSHRQSQREQQPESKLITKAAKAKNKKKSTQESGLKLERRAATAIKEMRCQIFHHFFLHLKQIAFSLDFLSLKH